jgi:purine-nucleoside phosphorylase
MPGYICPIASYKLIKKSDEIKEKLGLKNIFFGNILSHDMFYNDTQKRTDYEKIGILASEMESYALFMLAQMKHKKAGCILTISDSFCESAVLAANERQEGLATMIKVGILTAEQFA